MVGEVLTGEGRGIRLEWGYSLGFGEGALRRCGDPGMGVIRRVGVGYERAAEVAAASGESGSDARDEPGPDARGEPGSWSVCRETLR
ncbi:hypothetical protein Misp01_00960 [Microtetraspora sp. NBRC 13810]|nr:hypothetical protein Misp01_00960 [Microtetraspora sp. NBRC 13810]